MQESDLRNQKIILASGSARRKEIFENHGLNPVVMPMDVDETLADGIAPQDAVMYLVNALAFDAEWQNIYNEYQIQDGKFTTEDGTVHDVELMYSNENSYLRDDKAEGFIKYYAKRKYAFAALLPNEGVSVSEYIASLDGEHLQEVLSGAKTTPVDAAIPKFETEYKAEMSEILKEMGMPDAFDGTLADFSKLGSTTDGKTSISIVSSIRPIST